MNTLFNYMALVVIVVMFGCKKTNFNAHEPIENDGTIPGVVTNAQVKENLPGAAVLKYTLPNDADLQYVVAEYSINGTSINQVKASRYTDTLFVEGFNQAKEYDVTLYAVDKSENRSAPVIVKIHPTTPVFRVVRATLDIVPDFGGASISFQNKTEAEIAISVIILDHNKEYKVVENFYTQQRDGSFSVRGLDTTERVFGVYVKDRWGNHSDTLFKTFKPIFEKALDKSKFTVLKLPNDQGAGYGWNMPNLWDKKLTEPGFHTTIGALPQPQRFTFDLGIKARLSRFKLLQRMGTWAYTHGNPKSYVIWGSGTAPNSDGSWDGWTKLLVCESKKPSGKPLGEVNEDDRQHALGTDGLGEEFVFPFFDAMRYIRIEVLENWSGTDFFHALEISFWGKPE